MAVKDKTKLIHKNNKDYQTTFVLSKKDCIMKNLYIYLLCMYV